MSKLTETSRIIEMAWEDALHLTALKISLVSVNLKSLR